MRVLVVLDMVFQLTVARRRLFQTFREAGDSPDVANLRLLSIIRWWSVRSTIGWFVFAHAALLVHFILPQAQYPSASWWMTVLFTLGLCLGTASALRLVTLSLNDELHDYLSAEREPGEMIDSPLHQGR